jgi:hypothetical protein
MNMTNLLLVTLLWALSFSPFAGTGEAATFNHGNKAAQQDGIEGRKHYSNSH